MIGTTPSSSWTPERSTPQSGWYRPIPIHGSWSDPSLGRIRHDHREGTSGGKAPQHGHEDFLSLAHVLVSPEGQRHGHVDEALAQRGKQRMLALSMPQMFAAPLIVASTRLTATVLKRVALTSSAARSSVISATATVATNHLQPDLASARGFSLRAGLVQRIDRVRRCAIVTPFSMLFNS